jgi:hypothetical protein
VSFLSKTEMERCVSLCGEDSHEMGVSFLSETEMERCVPLCGECCRLIHTWETWKKSSIHSVCPWGQVRVKVLSPNPQLLRLGQLLAKPRGVVPNKII